jgi:uncharacterized protein (DUF58 family)
MKLLEQKIRKLFSGSKIWQSKSFLKWDWLEITDSRKYELWDSFKTINWKLTAKTWELFVNIFEQQKNVDINIFCDVNRNWLWWKNQKNIQLVTERLIWIFSIIKKYTANMKWIIINKWKCSIYDIGSDNQKFYNFLNNLKDCTNNSTKKYISNIDNILNYEKKITKKHIIIIFSDFLNVSDNNIKLLKLLKEKNELFLFQVEISNIWWLNFDSWEFSKSNLDKLNFIEL